MKLSDWLPGVPVESNVMEPCPCCGSEKTTIRQRPDGQAEGGCLECGLAMFSSTVSGVLLKWNKRHVPWVDPKVRLPEKPRLGNPYVPVLVLLDGELSSDFAFYSTSEAFFSWERGGEAVTDTIVGWMYLPLINNVQGYYERSKKDADDAE